MPYTHTLTHLGVGTIAVADAADEPQVKRRRWEEVVVVVVARREQLGRGARRRRRGRRRGALRAPWSRPSARACTRKEKWVSQGPCGKARCGCLRSRAAYCASSRPTIESRAVCGTEGKVRQCARVRACAAAAAAIAHLERHALPAAPARVARDGVGAEAAQTSGGGEGREGGVGFERGTAYWPWPGTRLMKLLVKAERAREEHR